MFLFIYRVVLAYFALFLLGLRPKCLGPILGPNPSPIATSRLGPTETTPADLSSLPLAWPILMRGHGLVLLARALGPRSWPHLHAST